MKERLIVGRIVGAHGIRGECSVEVLSEAPERFESGSVLDVEHADFHTLTVRASRSHKQRLLVSFDEINDRNGAESLRGAWLSIDAESAPVLDEGQFYAHQIQGCDVFDEEDRMLGILTAVLENPAHDIWVVRTPSNQEVMVPAVKEFVKHVDAESKRIVLAPIEGMF
ncbi:MAG: ribosome maturation factor RimM [Actinomycetota bacterium]